MTPAPDGVERITIEPAVVRAGGTEVDGGVVDGASPGTGGTSPRAGGDAAGGCATVCSLNARPGGDGGVATGCGDVAGADAVAGGGVLTRPLEAYPAANPRRSPKISVKASGSTAGRGLSGLISTSSSVNNRVLRTWE